MSRRIAVVPYLVATVLVCARLSFQDGQMKMVVGTIGEPITLPCPVTPDQAPNMEWVDFVYNSNHDPKLIFRAKDNPSYEIDVNHPRMRNLGVDSSYSLTLSNVTTPDSGDYFCRVMDKDGGYTKLHAYNLAVRGTPECTGETSVRKGGSTELTCQMKFVGNEMPDIEFRSDGKLQSADDHSGLEQVKKVLQLSQITADMDQKEYVCEVTVAGQTSNCKMTLNVKYVVEGVEVSPQKDQYVVGDKITCSANGNPVPTITWSPEVGKVEDAEGMKSFVIPPEWEGETKTLKCTASNMVMSETTLINRNITLTKIGEQAPEPGSGNGAATTTAGTGKTAIIIGVIVAVVVVAVIITAIVIAKKRRSKKPKGAQPVPSSDQEEVRKSAGADGQGGSPGGLSKGGDRNRNSNGMVYYNKGPKDSTYITNTPEDLDPDTPWRRHTDRV